MSINDVRSWYENEHLPKVPIECDYCATDELPEDLHDHYGDQICDSCLEESTDDQD